MLIKFEMKQKVYGEEVATLRHNWTPNDTSFELILRDFVRSVQTIIIGRLWGMGAGCIMLPWYEPEAR